MSSIENSTTEVVQNQVLRVFVVIHVDSVRAGLEKLVDARAKETDKGIFLTMNKG